MTQVDFYEIATPGLPARLEFAAKFVEKVYRAGWTVHVHLDDPALLDRFDTLLWTYREVSFVPHEIAHTPVAGCPVTLGIGEFAASCGVLVNLARGVPEFACDFERVAEVVQADSEDIGEARNRFRFYKNHGYTLLWHPIR